MVIALLYFYGKAYQYNEHNFNSSMNILIITTLNISVSDE